MRPSRPRFRDLSFPCYPYRAQMQSPSLIGGEVAVRLWVVALDQNDEMGN